VSGVAVSQSFWIGKRSSIGARVVAPSAVSFVIKREVRRDASLDDFEARAIVLVTGTGGGTEAARF